VSDCDDSGDWRTSPTLCDMCSERTSEKGKKKKEELMEGIGGQG